MSLTVTPRLSRDRPLVPAGLSAQLRAETRQEHVAAESAFDVGTRLLDLPSYRQLLMTLGGFYLPLEAALTRVAGWRGLAHPVDISVHLRGDLLVEDLRRLGAALHLTPVRGVDSQLPKLDPSARALGVLYVVAGSALGGQVIARNAREALGDDVPVAFFSSAGRPHPMHQWRALQATLDDFGITAGPLRRDQIVQSAAETFRALTRRLDAHE